MNLDAVERQKAWECWTSDLGQKNYNEKLVTLKGREKDLADTDHGEKLTNELLKPLSATFARYKTNIVDNAKGSTLEAVLPLGMASADALAMITLRAVLSFKTFTDRERLLEGRPQVGLAKKIAKMIRTDIQYNNVLRDAQARAKKGDIEKAESQLLLQDAKGQVSSKTLWKWRKKIDALNVEPWEEDDEIKLGTICLTLLCETFPHYFSISEVRASGKTHKRLILSEAFSNRVDELHTDTALAQPQLLPTLIEPLDWTLEH